ncbi:regulatory protein suaprga1 [Panaeolus papilionaceus]|nr:regulatory protein suaprga1 [Panaeolus papilionaceus]
MSAFAALRTVARAQAIRPARMVAGMRVSLLSTVARPSLVSSNVLSRASLRAFSASAGRFGSGTTDVALSQKLQEELKYEQETAADNQTPEGVRSFLEQGVWSIEDVRGNDEVTLSRKFGDESIRVMFSIADITEDNLLEDTEAENEEEDVTPPAAIRASVSITKANAPGCINVDLFCQEDTFVIENISFYENAKLGTELTAEADWQRRGVYIGPQFETLDQTVQDEFEKYLNERGINETLATFIPEYATHKEQQEYVKWLGKVRSFVDA